MIKVLRPGTQSTIQDRGRIGWMHLGISHSGAMDALAHRIANRLVGMPEDNPVIEMTQVGADFEFRGPLQLALAGAPMRYLLNGEPAPHQESFQVKTGDRLEFQSCDAGFRTYLACDALLNVSDLLNSVSTQVNAGLGGFHGRPLMKADNIPCLKLAPEHPIHASFPALHYSGHYQLRYTNAPEHHYFSSAQKSSFQKQRFQVSQELSRMGVRLAGTGITFEQYATYQSRGLVPGAIQIPPDGQPIIAGADAQTTGGYLRIGQIIRADMPVVGQLKPGDSVQFQPIELADASHIYQQQLAQISKMQMNVF